MKFLIVDEQPIIIKALTQTILEYYPGSNINGVSNIAAASSSIKKYNFDLIIASLDFKGEKQFDIIALAKIYELKCIVYSGHFNIAFINKSFEFSAIAFISKLGDLDELSYAIKNFRTLDRYICSFCKQSNLSKNKNEFLFPDLKGFEELILDRLLTQMPRRKIAKEFKIKSDTLNTYINRMTAKNNCNLLALIHRYIIWKRSKI